MKFSGEMCVHKGTKVRSEEKHEANGIERKNIPEMKMDTRSSIHFVLCICDGIRAKMRDEFHLILRI